MFRVEDYDNMQYNPVVVPAGKSVLEFYVKLKIYPEFNSIIPDVDRNLVLRYIFCMYCIGSPFFTIDNVMQRKVIAAREVGFPVGKDGMHIKEYQSVMYGKNAIVNAMIIRFCRLQHSMAFTKLMLFEDSLYQEYFNLSNAKDGAIRARLMQNIDTLEKSLKNITLAMFVGQDDILEKSMWDEIDKEKLLELSPEFIAKKEPDVNDKEDVSELPVDKTPEQESAQRDDLIQFMERISIEAPGTVKRGRPKINKDADKEARTHPAIYKRSKPRHRK